MRETSTFDDAPFTVAQALGLGFSEDDIRTQVRSGRWIRLRRGVLVTRGGRTAASRNDTTLHAQDIRALCLAMPRRSLVAAGTSAARIQALPLHRRPDDELVVVVDSARSLAGTHRDGYYLRSARLPAGHVEVHDGLRVTSPARTVVDLAAHLGLDDGVVAAEGAYRSGLMSQAHLAATIGDLDSRPGIETARECLAFADPASGSVLESISRLAMHRLGIPMPRTQVVLLEAGGLFVRVDFLWAELRLVGEADGMAKYSMGGRDPIHQLRLERERERLIRDLGFDIVRWDWHVANNPRLLDARLRAAFAGAAERRSGRAV